MRQLVQLQEHMSGFRQAGINVVVITYDEPHLQQAFIDAQAISFPIISDVDATTMKALGILNTEYEPGDGAYGIPHPGIFVIDRQKTIVDKIFVEGYIKRVKAEVVLARAKQALNIDG